MSVNTTSTVNQGAETIEDAAARKAAENINSATEMGIPQPGFFRRNAKTLGMSIGGTVLIIGAGMLGFKLGQRSQLKKDTAVLNGSGDIDAANDLLINQANGSLAMGSTQVMH